VPVLGTAGAGAVAMAVGVADMVDADTVAAVVITAGVGTTEALIAEEQLEDSRAAVASEVAQSEEVQVSSMVVAVVGSTVEVAEVSMVVAATAVVGTGNIGSKVLS
jgi:hypothetical protein